MRHPKKNYKKKKTFSGNINTDTVDIGFNDRSAKRLATCVRYIGVLFYTLESVSTDVFSVGANGGRKLIVLFSGACYTIFVCSV